MADAIAHRGPDGHGVWSHPSGMALSHRRLAIIDLSLAGLQPMTSHSGRYVISFNGEIYNFEELRRLLEREGRAPPWRGSSDTEVMLAAIEAWGLESAVSRFIGMFAFALADTVEQRLHLVRDRLGIKPLYHARVPAGFCFASEVKALRRVPGYDTTVDRSVLAAYLAANCVPGERAIFRGTLRVPPGTILTFSGPSDPPIRSQYWNPASVAVAGVASPFTGSEDEAVDQLEQLLRSAVKYRMVADVPLGAFLSGGVDSSTVVALMQAQSSRPVHTFSIATESAAFDESDAARAVARHLNTHHTPLTATAKDALDVIPLLPGMYDEPFADSSQIPTFLVARLARSSVTVALSGDGGDELFGGYTRHVWAPRVWTAAEFIPPQLRSALARAIAGRSPAQWDELFSRSRPIVPPLRIAGIRMHKLASALEATSADAMYQRLASHWTPEDSVLDEEIAPDEALPAPAGLDVLDAMMYRDLVGYLPDDILTKVDRATMAVSLEAREPLLDHRLIEFAWRLPRGMKVRGSTGKWILRQVLARHVPPALISGPKAGFGIPLGDWLRGPLRDWAESLLTDARLRDSGFNVAPVRLRWSEHLAGIRPWEYHLWDVLMYQAWREENSPSG